MYYLVVLCIAIADVVVLFEMSHLVSEGFSPWVGGIFLAISFFSLLWTIPQVSHPLINWLTILRLRNQPFSYAHAAIEHETYQKEVARLLYRIHKQKNTRYGVQLRL